MVTGSASFDFRRGHRHEGRSVERFFGAVRFQPNKPPVTVHSRGSSGLAHFLSPGGLK